MRAIKWLMIAYAMIGFSSCVSAQSVDTHERTIHQATEFFAVPLIIALIVWVVWKVRTKKREEEKDRLDEAWHTVLSDPNYLHRRRYEEYKSEVNAKAHQAEAQARKTEGL